MTCKAQFISLLNLTSSVTSSAIPTTFLRSAAMNIAHGSSLAELVPIIAYAAIITIACGVFGHAVETAFHTNVTKHRTMHTDHKALIKEATMYITAALVPMCGLSWRAVFLTMRKCSPPLYIFYSTWAVPLTYVPVLPVLDIRRRWAHTAS